MIVEEYEKILSQGLSNEKKRPIVFLLLDKEFLESPLPDVSFLGTDENNKVQAFVHEKTEEALYEIAMVDLLRFSSGMGCCRRDSWELALKLSSAEVLESLGMPHSTDAGIFPMMSPNELAIVLEDKEDKGEIEIKTEEISDDVFLTKTLTKGKTVKALYSEEHNSVDGDNENEDDGENGGECDKDDSENEDGKEEGTPQKEQKKMGKAAGRMLYDQMKKEKGSGSNPIEEMLKRILDIQIPWDVILGSAIKSSFKSSSPSWSKPRVTWFANPRSTPLLPNKGKEPDLGPLYIYYDTSGSMSTHELEKGLCIVKTLEKHFSRIVYTQHAEELGEPLSFDRGKLKIEDCMKITITGGTSHRHVFRDVENRVKSGEKPSLIICFTDMYSDHIQFEHLCGNIPLVYADSSGEGKSSKGRVIHVK